MRLIVVTRTQVPTFTPVGDELSLSNAAALYLTPFLCTKEVAVITPGAIDAQGNQDCTRKEFKTNMLATVFKVASYILTVGILPLLAVLLNVLIRCKTKYQYVNIAQPNVGGQPATPATPTPAAPRQADPTLPTRVNNATAAMIRPPQVNPQPIEPVTPPGAGEEDLDTLVAQYLNMGLSNEDLEAMKSGATEMQCLALDMAIEMATALNGRVAPAPVAAAPAKAKTGPKFDPEKAIRDAYASPDTDDELLAKKALIPEDKHYIIDEAIMRRNLDRQPQKNGTPAIDPAIRETAIQQQVNSNETDAELLAKKARVPDVMKDAIDEALKRRKAARELQNGATPVQPPAAKAETNATLLKKAEIDAITDPGAIRAIYAVAMEAATNDPSRENHNQIGLVLNRATELGVILEQSQEEIREAQRILEEKSEKVQAIKANLRNYEKLDDIDQINAAYRREVQALSENSCESVANEATLTNIEALKNKANELGYELSFKEAPKKKEDATAPKGNVVGTGQASTYGDLEEEFEAATAGLMPVQVQEARRLFAKKNETLGAYAEKAVGDDELGAKVEVLNDAKTVKDIRAALAVFPEIVPANQPQAAPAPVARSENKDNAKRLKKVNKQKPSLPPAQQPTQQQPAPQPIDAKKDAERKAKEARATALLAKANTTASQSQPTQQPAETQPVQQPNNQTVDEARKARAAKIADALQAKAKPVEAEAAPLVHHATNRAKIISAHIRKKPTPKPFVAQTTPPTNQETETTAPKGEQLADAPAQPKKKSINLDLLNNDAFLSAQILSDLKLFENVNITNEGLLGIINDLKIASTHEERRAAYTAYFNYRQENS